MKVKDELKQAHHEEKEAIADYKKSTKVAKKAGDKMAAKLFTHIGKDEKHHKHELSKLLKKRK
jgi:rubrerythrin